MTQSAGATGQEPRAQPDDARPPLAIVAGGGRGEALRRTVDIVVAGVGLPALAPVFAAVGIAIRLESQRPVFFFQTRVGRHGRPFRIVKFRTMVHGADRMGPKVSGARDRRVTRVGAFLRASKLDELPQLWNVLRGDMTLFGPRAEVPDYVRHFSDEERLILTVKPGLTGPSAIYFATDQAPALDGVEDVEAHYVEHQLHPKLALDLDYVRRRSWRTDLALIGKTALLLLGRRPSVSGPLPVGDELVEHLA